VKQKAKEPFNRAATIIRHHHHHHPHHQRWRHYPRFGIETATKVATCNSSRQNNLHKSNSNNGELTRRQVALRNVTPTLENTSGNPAIECFDFEIPWYYYY